MRIRAIPARELTNELASAWERIVDSEPTLASPYFHPEFTRAVAIVRGDVFVSVIEDAGQIVAFFPFQRGALHVGRPVGGPMSDHHGLIAAPAFNLSASELLRASGLASWTFDHCLACQTVFSSHRRSLGESPVMDLSAGYEAYTAGRRAAGSKQILKTEGLARKWERETGPIRFTAHVADAAVLEQCIEWKRSHYAEMKVNDVFGVEWTKALLREVLRRQSAGFAGMLSTLHVGDALVAVHMGMRSRTVWHYWFPTYDRDMGKFSPGIILLLRMAQAAPDLGLTTIDLGKGSTMYKDRLSTGSVQITEGCVQLPSLATSLGQLRRSSEEWVRRSPFFGAARIPGRFVKRAEKWLRFR
jgi:CelD/BcsL family acetyltransferase involved in cellulose biosynthesis